VFNILLQILEDGHLTDAKGRRVDFRNTVIIMTSNVGAQQLQRDSSIGFRTVGATEAAQATADYDRMKEKVLGELKNTFRPEFLNRIDEIIVFEPLDDAALSAIVDLLVADLAHRLADLDLELVLTPQARALIGREGHDPQYGARPLKRAVQRLLENPLARALLEGQFKPGSTITADADPAGGTIVITGSGGGTVVSEPEERRDARVSGTPVGAGIRPSLMDLPPTDTPGERKDRLN
jgi:ATP-dependent Clp protease ATP-binding subunit ClpC